MPASAHFEGVKVEVVSNGQSLSLYDDPDAIENEEPRKRQNYIEAVTGATFEVRVTLSDPFEMGRCDAVRIDMSFDGDERGVYNEISRTPEWKNRPLKHRQIVFSRIQQFCEGSGQWRSGKLCFGELAISETMGSDETPKEVQMLGQIRLMIERVKHTGIVFNSSKRPRSRVGQVYEKIMKGKAITNTIDFTDYKVITEPPPSVQARRIGGPLGKRLYWNIMYRSKRTLQMLGCIDRTPSPDAETTNEPRQSAAKRDRSGVADHEQVIKDLRAQLAVLKGEPNIKSETPNTRARVKRERDDCEITGARKKARGSDTIDVVDLTSDYAVCPGAYKDQI